MSAYPEWVNQYKQKGTAVKKVGNSYYLYKATSKRVPGKKYPQPIHTYIGTITQDGLVVTAVRKISTETVHVYECGFSYTLSRIIPEKFRKDIGDEVRANYAFLNIVRCFSPESYLLRDLDLPTMEDLHMSLSVQTKKFERLAGVRLEELLVLSRIYLVETKECDMISAATPEMVELMAKMGVNIGEIQT
jgi:hypothetical protein